MTDQQKQKRHPKVAFLFAANRSLFNSLTQQR